MSSRSRYVEYNAGIFCEDIVSDDSLKKFMLSIKSQILPKESNKLIYEAQAVKINKKINPQKNRYISSVDDNLLLFSAGDPSSIANVVYNDYNRRKLCPVYNGRAILIASKIYAHTEFYVNQANNLFSIVVCDFSKYQLKKFVDQHELFNLNINHRIV